MFRIQNEFVIYEEPNNHIIIITITTIIIIIITSKLTNEVIWDCRKKMVNLPFELW